MPGTNAVAAAAVGRGESVLAVVGAGVAGTGFAGSAAGGGVGSIASAGSGARASALTAAASETRRRRPNFGDRSGENTQAVFAQDGGIRRAGKPARRLQRQNPSAAKFAVIFLLVTTKSPVCHGWGISSGRERTHTHAHTPRRGLCFDFLVWNERARSAGAVACRRSATRGSAGTCSRSRSGSAASGGCRTRGVPAGPGNAARDASGFCRAPAAARRRTRSRARGSGGEGSARVPGEADGRQERRILAAR